MGSPASGDLLLGRYRLEVPLGAGGAATVWRARDTRLGRPVALKSLPKRSRSAAAAVAEARTVARLSNPHITALYELAEDDSCYYLVTELVDGTDLETVASAGPLSPEEAAAVLAPVALALANAHRVGVAHGDVKPANVLLGRDGSVKLADFGAAGYARAAGRRSRSIEASPAYAAPEILQGASPSPAADLYGLGATLIRVLGGADTRHPPAGLPAPMRTLVKLLTAEDPRDRSSGVTAAAAAEGLDLLAAGLERRTLTSRLANRHARFEPVASEALGAGRQQVEPRYTAELLGRLWPAAVLGAVCWAATATLIGSPVWAALLGAAAAAAALLWPFAVGIAALLLGAAALIPTSPVATALLIAIGAPLWVLLGRRYPREILAPVLVPAMGVAGAPLAAAALLARTLSGRYALLGAVVGSTISAVLAIAGLLPRGVWVALDRPVGSGSGAASQAALTWRQVGPAYGVPLLAQAALTIGAAAVLAAAARGPRWLGPTTMGAVCVAAFALLAALPVGPALSTQAAYADISLSLILGAAAMAAAPSHGRPGQ